MASTSYSNWDFHNYHVQQDLKGGQFVSAESTLIAAGPPNLDVPSSDPANPQQSAGDPGALVYPIGMLESVGLQQNKQLQRIFEIGSTRSYFVPGRTIGSISIGRTFYYGPSLMRVLYAYYKNKQGTNGSLVSVGQGTAAQVSSSDGGTIPNPEAALITGGPDLAELHGIRRTPGEGYFWVDLASDVFAQPTGLAIYFKDANSVSVGALYCEEAYIQGHQMTVSSGSVLIMEGVSMQYDRIRPIKMT